ncbi:MAG: winged helix-turn-helix transcriptional regulator [SAR202 cluster bacterium]|nr:winged helix-turn-helix transcriptional regulator [SAR202 cluster bacterium]
MRSQREQQDPSESHAYRELQLLSRLDESPDATQRQLSVRLGIALGLTNVLLRSMVQKGYIKVIQATWKRRLYTLTPTGFSRRISLMADYVHKVLDHYQSVRQTLREQLQPLALNAESRVAIFGTGEFAELVYLGLKELSIEEIDVFELQPATDRRFLGMPVRELASLQSEHYDRVIVAQLVPQLAEMSKIKDRGVSSEQLVKFFSNGKAKGGL